MAEDELRNMERMVSLTLKLEANVAAEKSGKKTPRTESPKAESQRTESPRTKPKVVKASSPKQSSSKSGTKSPPKEKTKSGTSRLFVILNSLVLCSYLWRDFS